MSFGWRPNEARIKAAEISIFRARVSGSNVFGNGLLGPRAKNFRHYLLFYGPTWGQINSGGKQMTKG